MSTCRMKKDSHGLFVRSVWTALWLGVLLGSSTAYAQEIKLVAQDGTDGDAFGIAVSLSGGWGLVGASNQDGERGAAYIFGNQGNNNWRQSAKLTPDSREPDDRFGGAVSLDGNRALIGANGRDDTAPNAGAAYVYRLDNRTWVEEAMLTASDAAASDLFGSSVSLDGERALIGAYQKNDETGAAYVFRLENGTWTEEAKLTASDGADNDWFGFSVSLDGDRAAVGAYLDDDDGSGSGAVYIFRRDGSTWVQEDKLTASDAAPGDRFGESVSLSGDRVLIGAWGFGGSSGAAYVFRRDGNAWVEEDKLTADDARTNDRFSERAVSLSGDRALIGAWSNGDSGPVTGSAYLFRRSGNAWVQDGPRLLGGDSTSGDGFGVSVSVDGEALLVGAFGNGEKGAAYVFGPTMPVAVDEEAGVPDAFALHGNYPNPFNPSTEIHFDLPKRAHATLVIYNAMGQEVARLIDGPLQAGVHTTTWEAAGMSSGAYLYRLTAGTFSETRVMVLLR